MSTAYKLVARKNRPEGSTVSIGDVVIGGTEFVVAAGPCAVESRDQLLQAATGVAAGGARLLRAGAFKPRTSPYAFQGLGEEGLQLLALAHFVVHQQVIDPGEQILIFIRFADEVVGTAFESFHDVADVGERSEQDYGNIFEAFVVFYFVAESKAVHYGHHDITDYQGRPVLSCRGEGLSAISGGPGRIAFRLKQIPQFFRLGRAVFCEEYFHAAAMEYFSHARRIPCM